MGIKSGVCITGIRPEMLLGLMIAESVFREAGVDLVITSIVDGKHSHTSLHYAGAAVDFRTKHMKAGQADIIVGLLKDALPDDFDIINEGDHIHMEWQPRRRR